MWAEGQALVRWAWKDCLGQGVDGVLPTPTTTSDTPATGDHRVRLVVPNGGMTHYTSDTDIGGGDREHNRTHRPPAADQGEGRKYKWGQTSINMRMGVPTETNIEVTRDDQRPRTRSAGHFRRTGGLKA